MIRKKTSHITNVVKNTEIIFYIAPFIPMFFPMLLFILKKIMKKSNLQPIRHRHHELGTFSGSVVIYYTALLLIKILTYNSIRIIYSTNILAHGMIK